jgi:hypothetical protein
MDECKNAMADRLALHRDTLRMESERVSQMRGVEEEIAAQRLRAMREAEVREACMMHELRRV